MSPFKVEIKNEEGEWEFGSYAFNMIELSNLVNAYSNKHIRVHWDGVLQLESDANNNTIDFTVN